MYRIHCLGIGGAGMSGMAEILKSKQYGVSGSDLVVSKNVTRLIRLGIPITLNAEDFTLVSQADCVVYSSAISAHHPERQWANEKGIPMVSRGEMLAFLIKEHVSIAVAGTHGKTSTVGLLAQVFMQQQLNPTVLIGGYLKSIQSHAVFGEGPHFLTEADESDQSLLYLRPNIAVVTNIDKDHLGQYDYNWDRLIDTYRKFMRQAKAQIVICDDDPVLKKIKEETFIASTVSYGFDAAATLQVVDFQQSDTQMYLRISRKKMGQPDLCVTAPLLGRHNAYNVLAAVTVAILSNISDTAIQQGLAVYRGVSRRLEKLGTVRLPQGFVQIMDDYGHHPHEIKATMQALRCVWPKRRIVLIFQLHRYTRTRDLFKEFSEVLAQVADQLFLLPIYAAGEMPIAGIDHRYLADAICQTGNRPILIDEHTLEQTLHLFLHKEDIVLFQGAGDIGKIARSFQSKWTVTKET